jgi:hypothetical protein
MGVANMGHSACIGTPDVGAGLEGNDNDIEGGPGDEAEMEVVNHAGSIKDMFGLSGEASGFVGGGEGCGEGVTSNPGLVIDPDNNNDDLELYGALV